MKGLVNSAACRGRGRGRLLGLWAQASLFLIYKMKEIHRVLMKI